MAVTRRFCSNQPGDSEFSSEACNKLSNKPSGAYLQHRKFWVGFLEGGISKGGANLKL